MQNRLTGWDAAEKYTILYLEFLHGDINKFFQKMMEEVPGMMPDVKTDIKLQAKYAGQLFERNALRSIEDEYPICDILQSCTTKVKSFNDSAYAHWMVSKIAKNLRDEYAK